MILLANVVLPVNIDKKFTYIVNIHDIIDLIDNNIIQDKKNINSDIVLNNITLNKNFNKFISRPKDELIKSLNDILIGAFVLVPFRNKKLVGIIHEIKLTEAIETTQTTETTVKIVKNTDFNLKLKKIERIIINLPKLSNKILQFINWVAEYTISPIGFVQKMVISLPDKQLLFIDKNTNISVNISVTTKSEQLTTQTLKFAHTNNSLQGSNEHVISDIHLPFTNQIILNKEQKQIFDSILHNIKNHKVHIIEGVTGSGKTEVYLSIAMNILLNGGQVLVLVPEITLSTQLSQRFKSTLGINQVAEWHSATSITSKRNTWLDIQTGKCNFVTGARSALFLPFQNLKLIIIDEEHDISFKQTDNVIYHCRDMAIVRSKIENIPILLVSATPSIETIVNAVNNKFIHHKMYNRYSGVIMPEVKILDMKAQLQTKFSQYTDKYNDDVYKTNNKRLDSELKSFSIIPSNSLNILHHDVVSALIEFYNNKKQSLIFLNRRGYATVIFCKSCFSKAKCINCKFWLVYHKAKGRIECHYCGHSSHELDTCISCGEKNTTVSYGYGVERIEEEIGKIIPNAKIAVLTSDLTSNIKLLRSTINAITNHEVDIIIGTQVIAKGLHFSKLQMVAILDADPIALGCDIRIMERTYQLFHQVIGRVGREKERGLVLIQTYDKDNIMLKQLSEFKNDEFLKSEIQNRIDAKMPPFSRISLIKCSSTQEMKLLDFLNQMAERMPSPTERLIILGPAPAPLNFVNGQYRYRFVIYSDNKLNIQKIIQEWVAMMKVPSNISIKIDIDPYHFN